ncbi:MAG: hypothetical protein IJ243_05030 [Prevotella sp.]|nr:hypothetical protein [Prevotella sp.]
MAAAAANNGSGREKQWQRPLTSKVLARLITKRMTPDVFIKKLTKIMNCLQKVTFLIKNIAKMLRN